ncbi:TPA: helix-turn-helix transcriptional regulator [Enterococcus faecalis]|nr:helix-turn-helix transcriptional regulator [Enterococcus faecalis]
MGDKQISLKAVRVNNGYTQEALAQKLGVATKTISEWENGKVPIKPLTIFAIAYVFKMDSDLIRI